MSEYTIHLLITLPSFGADNAGHAVASATTMLLQKLDAANFPGVSARVVGVHDNAVLMSAATPSNVGRAK